MPAIGGFGGRMPEETDNLIQDRPVRGASQPETREHGRKSAAREWLESLAFSLVFVFFLAPSLQSRQATQVPTESMKPTILVGDHFLL